MSAHAPHDKLLDLLYGELPPEEASALRADIDADPELRAAFEELRAARERIAQHTSPPARVSSTLTDLILEDARTHAPSPTRSAPDPRQSLWRRAWQSPGFRHSLVAAALLVGVAGILRTLQLDSAPRHHDPLAEHGMAAPVSFESSSPTTDQEDERSHTPAADEAPVEEAATVEKAEQAEIAEIAEDTLAENVGTIGAAPPASTRTQNARPSRASGRSAPVVTTDQPPAREAEPQPRQRRTTRAEADRTAASSGAALADTPTGGARSAPQPAVSPRPLDRSYGSGGLGASAAPQERADAFAETEDRIFNAPTRDSAPAPQAEPAPVAQPEGASPKRRSAAPSTSNELADSEAAAEADISASDEIAEPAPSPLQRARQARAEDDPATTLVHATQALSTASSPRARAEAYTLIAWAHEELGNDDAAQQARQQAATILREFDATSP